MQNLGQRGPGSPTNGRLGRVFSAQGTTLGKGPVHTGCGSKFAWKSFDIASVLCEHCHSQLRPFLRVMPFCEELDILRERAKKVSPAHNALWDASLLSSFYLQD